MLHPAVALGGGLTSIASNSIIAPGATQEEESCVNEPGGDFCTVDFQARLFFLAVTLKWCAALTARPAPEPVECLSCLRVSLSQVFRLERDDAQLGAARGRVQPFFQPHYAHRSNAGCRQQVVRSPLHGLAGFLLSTLLRLSTNVALTVTVV
jgi:hypothetical protein